MPPPTPPATPDAAAAAPAAAPAELSAALFAPGAHAYAVADGAARDGFLEELFEAGAPPAPLLKGELDDATLALAPHLVALAPEAPSTALLLAGWGRAECVFLRSSLDFADLADHLANVAEVETPAGRALFRFYDPRVLRGAAPALTPAHRAEFFGDAVDCLFCEDEAGRGLLRFDP